MLCCLLAAGLLVPLGARFVPRLPGGACCTIPRLMAGLAVLAAFVAVACVAAYLLQPAPFHHICRFLARS